MKKTLLITQDFPPLLGGIANYYYNRVQKMKREDIVVLMNKISNKNFRISDFGFRIYFKNYFLKYIWPHWLPLIWHIYNTVKKEKIKMLWVGQVLPVGTAVWLLSILLSFPRRRESKIQYFVTCHGNDLLRAKQHPKKYKLAKKILRDAKFVEANTEFTKNILMQDFDISENKIKIVYPECTLSQDQVDENKVQKLCEKYNLKNKKVLITVARLVKSKGVENVIKALPDDPNLVYLIIGDGPDKNRLQQIADTGYLPLFRGEIKEGVNKNIILTGPIPHSELPNYYSLANAFILTPHSDDSDDTESFGIVYLEALKFGLPVIAGNTGGVKEIKNENITLVNSKNINEINKNIAKLLNC